MAENGIILGIDLGTTNSLVAVADERGPRVLRDADGVAMVPSVLAFDGQGQVTIGAQAKAHAVENPTATLFSIKRLMGRGYEELVAGGELAHLPFNVVKRVGNSAERDIAAIEVGGRLMTPPELSAMILRELKARAERQLGQPVNRAVVTVPAYFDDAQRQATRDAGRIAGLEVLRIVNEPTAAALAYGLGIRGQMAGGGRAVLKMAGECASSEQCIPETPAQDAVIVVYDLGGGTFDVSVLQVVDGVFEVLSTHGNTMLGGDDLDREIMQMVHREVQQQFGIQIDSPSTRQALRTFAEAVKVRLSTQDSAQIEIALDAERVYRRSLTRVEFEGMIAPWVERTIDSCRQALRDAKLTPQQIEQVVMVGGSTRIPLVRGRVQELFGRVPYTAINPDEVVALGAAVQASILAGRRQDALLLDVIPLSLGIETMGGAMGKLILRNTRVPCQASELFSTFVDGQTNVKINVLQGERELAKDCRSLGEFELRGIPPMPAGLPKIRVTFLIDENGILNVSAREERSGQQASIQVVPAHGLTREEVRAMELESYAYAAEDLAAHWLVDLRVQVEFDTHKAEQMLAKAGDRLDPAERQEIEQAMQRLRELAASSEDSAMLWTALRAFDRRTVRLAEVAIVKALE